jgi:integrase/recombinase XerC
LHIQDALADYLVQLEADGRSKHTVGQYSRFLTQLGLWMERVLGTPDLDALRHQELARFLVSDDATKKADGKPKKPSSMNALRSCVRAFFIYCEVADYTAKNPARLVKRAVVGEPAIRSLSEREVRLLRAALAQAASPSERRDRVLIELMLRTGVRLASALALEVQELELDDGLAYVLHMKRGKQMTVRLDAPLVDLLREHVGDGTYGPLFLNDDGEPLSDRSVQRRFKRWLDRAGIRRPASPHALRHTFATRMYEQTRDLELVRVAMGHASVATTGRYAMMREVSRG